MYLHSTLLRHTLLKTYEIVQVLQNTFLNREEKKNRKAKNNVKASLSLVRSFFGQNLEYGGGISNFSDWSKVFGHKSF